jgi:hypothetical protein
MFERNVRGLNGLAPCHAPCGRPAYPIRLYAIAFILAAMLTFMHGGLTSAEPVTPRAPLPQLRLAPLLPDSDMLVPPGEPDCEFRTSDPNANERQRLDYERQCFRHAEMIMRSRLELLQEAIERYFDVTSAVASARPTLEPSAARSIEPAGVQRFIENGDRHIMQGNIAIAREYYSRAAEFGSGIAAMKMAETYDPHELARLNARGVMPNPAEALRWYQRAENLKAPEAESRLLRLNGQ